MTHTKKRIRGMEKNLHEAGIIKKIRAINILFIAKSVLELFQK